MTEISCGGLLFDLDGVLIDSTPAVARVWTNWAKEHGFDPQEVVARAHGRPSISTIREYLPDADSEAENATVERAEIEDLCDVVALPGAEQLLHALPPERWTIVTSCTRPLAKVRLGAAGLPVPARFITASDVNKGKPHPEPFLKGAGLLGLPPSDCVVVEDAPAGARAGVAAGSRVIAFTTTFHQEGLRQAGATWILKDCRSISVLGAQPDKGLRLGFEECG
jgi:sugar-phosphatase